MEMKEKYKSKWLEAFRISILEFQIWVLELCADPCRPRTCADHVFLIYYLINFEIRILRGPFMRRPYVDNQIIQTAISSDWVKVIISDLEKDCLDLGNCRSSQNSEKRILVGTII